MTSQEESELLAVLMAMEADAKYSTPSRYSSNAILYPDNLITFSAFHMVAIQKYSDIDISHYIQNLKLITLIR